MFKKFSIVIICIVMLLSFVACSKDDSHQNDSASNQTEISSTNDTFKEEKGTNKTTSTTSSTENISNNESSTVSENTSKPTEETKSIFNTENVKRITFYAYYGGGKGSDVPAEHLDEIIIWLDSFEVDTSKEFPELVPPGTNTIYVEIAYSDGSIVKQGMDTTVIDGVTYYIIGAASPECYEEIISKTSLS